MVCAIARKAPMEAYLELETHPLVSDGYTFKLIITKNIRNVSWKYSKVFLNGINVHIIKANINIIIGDIVNIHRLTRDGFTHSFMRSLIASAIGCGAPIIITLLGPFRS